MMTTTAKAMHSNYTNKKEQGFTVDLAATATTAKK